MIEEYDENRMLRVLSRLEMAQKVAFATACAEWSFPLLEGFAGLTGQHALVQRGAAILTDLWGIAEGRLVARQQHWEPPAEIDSVTDLYPEGALAENALAAVAYASRTAASGEPQQATWAARQMYEAADLVASELLGARTTVDDSAEKVLVSSVPVRSSLEALHSYMRRVDAGRAPWRSLRDDSRSDGERWFALHVANR